MRILVHSLAQPGRSSEIDTHPPLSTCMMVAQL